MGRYSAQLMPGGLDQLKAFMNPEVEHWACRYRPRGAAPRREHSARAGACDRRGPFHRHHLEGGTCDGTCPNCLYLAFRFNWPGTSEAIGASFSGRRRSLLLVTGDGRFMHGGNTEFNTAVRSGPGLIVVICNDRSYGAKYILFRNKDMDPALSVFDWPDVAPVAEALGGRGSLSGP